MFGSCLFNVLVHPTQLGLVQIHILVTLSLFIMDSSYFPLRWESTGDQWWYASPIDWAAANGHYDVVRELLHLDTNLLIKLTSLRRIRRLETVWDDDSRFAGVARCRSSIARSLLHECESRDGRNSLIRAGYGGWLLYTAVSAGDVEFTRELLGRDPLLVFGEGEYGVTDIFYAAARSKDSEVFRLIFDHAVSPRSQSSNGVNSEFRWEMLNRAVYAAARGGNVEMVREFLKECSNVLECRDANGATLLHAAAGRGQVEVVKDLVASYDIVTSKDGQGNTALHIAAYRGHLPVIEALIFARPSCASLINYNGDTFLHMAVAGFRTPGFRRLDRQMELMRQLISGKIVDIRDIINIRNNDGRTTLHMAVIGNIHSNLVELLMTVPSINLNIRDSNGMTPLDLLSQHPRSASSELLIKRLIFAGGIANLKDRRTRSAIVSHLKTQGIGSSPGTSFKINDAEIFLCAGIENVSDVMPDRGSARPSSCSSTSQSDIIHIEPVNGNHSYYSGKKKPSSVNYAARRLKCLLRWPHQKGKIQEELKRLADDSSSVFVKKMSNLDDTPTPLRQRFSKPCSLPNNKRTLSVRNSLPSPSTKKKFAAGLMHGVIQAMPHLVPSSRSPSKASSVSSPLSEKQKVVFSEIENSSSSVNNDGSVNMSRKSSASHGSRLMNNYFCFGAQGLSVEDPISGQRFTRNYKRSVLSVA
ncbi:hypothetical protein QJS10_CPB04g01743 [Acorus calamus]|uniref:Uncharacterized protein n=1 Tax=Acorus calamus TaxID=4465 RepID=A0AAV9EYR0_ACOCL|nr:hypothetical protein QJS10_CPB04g01743 [Acorus calamus]